VEGYDDICLSTLRNLEYKPPFISAETECVAEDEVIGTEEALSTLKGMKALGYTKFKLVDQTSLHVLAPDEDFHTSPAGLIKFQKQHLVAKALRKLQGMVGLYNPRRGNFSRHRVELERKYGYFFPMGSSGPFGNDLEGEWMDYDTATKCLLKHRHDYFQLPNSISYGFWCDWHAKR
jgi:hypothetical protein